MRIEETERGDLRIVADAEERAMLHKLRKDDPQAFDCDVTMYNLLEGPLANSEYAWCNPEDIGALTSAPILCIRDESERITRAWGFMNYATTSVQEQLVKTGEAIFQRGDE